MSLDVKGVLGARAVSALKRPLWRAVKAVTGRRLQATTRFLDVGMQGGAFEARSRAVDERLPPGFAAVEHSPGRTVLRIMGVDYRKVDLLRPYLEVAVRTPVTYAPSGGKGLEGWWVFQMPVTSEEARWGGVDNYGFPQFVADIHFRRAGTRSIWTLEHHRQLVLELEADEVTTETRTTYLRSFTARDDDVVVESHFELFGRVGESPDLGSARVVLGFHEIADQLRAMGVESVGRSIHVPEATATLSEGYVIGRLGARRPVRYQEPGPFEAPLIEA